MESNCPNCGAPITGARCEYCGTVFHDPQHAALAERLATLEMQAAQMQAEATLISCIQPRYQNSFYPPLPTYMDALQASREALERRQYENALNSINIYKMKGERK